MRRPIALAALVLVAGACGGDDDALTPRAARSLGEQIDVVEFTIAAGEYGDARRGLDAVRRDTIRLTQNDAISEGRAPAILEAIDELERALAAAERGA